MPNQKEEKQKQTSTRSESNSPENYHSLEQMEREIANIPYITEVVHTFFEALENQEMFYRAEIPCITDIVQNFYQDTTGNSQKQTNPKNTN